MTQLENYRSYSWGEMHEEVLPRGISARKTLAPGNHWPCDRRPHLAKYGGCLALPDARQAALTVGNACVDWMRGGLRDAEVLGLKLLCSIGQ